MRKFIFYMIVLQLVVVGCNKVSQPEVEPKCIMRLDQTLASFATNDTMSLASLSNEQRTATKTWFSVQAIDTISDELIKSYSGSKAVTVFMPDVEKLFGSEDSVARVLALIDENISGNFPDYKPLDVVAVISPYNQSVFIADSLLFIGLNHYLGAEYEGYGYFESYQRQVKTAQHLPYDVAEAMIKFHSEYMPVSNQTVLNHILYEGAVLYAIMQVVPQPDIAEAMGYTASQLKWVEENESQIWNRIIELNLLYSTSTVDADYLLKPSPGTAKIHMECPGRVARYLGYKIVKSYIENNSDTNLSFLLSMSFYSDVSSLIKSKYAAR